MEEIKIRTVRVTDYEEIDKLIVEAFQNSEHGYSGEAELVRRIREDARYKAELEIVAERNHKVVGHALLSEIQVKNANQQSIGLALAPLAVATNIQRKGIGGQLIREAEKLAVKSGYHFISILGNPDYYGHFGYTPASRHGISAPFDVPDEVFLVRELVPDGLKDVSGVVEYLPAFDE